MERSPMRRRPPSQAAAPPPRTAARPCRRKTPPARPQPGGGSSRARPRRPSAPPAHTRQGHAAHRGRAHRPGPRPAAAAAPSRRAPRARRRHTAGMSNSGCGRAPRTVPSGRSGPSRRTRGTRSADVCRSVAWAPPSCALIGQRHLAVAFGGGDAREPTNPANRAHATRFARDRDGRLRRRAVAGRHRSAPGLRDSQRDHRQGRRPTSLHRPHRRPAGAERHRIGRHHARAHSPCRRPAPRSTR